MKPILHPKWGWRSLLRITTLFVLALSAITASKAQLPDCSSGTYMYSIWNDSTAANKPSEIRAINYSTGALGPVLGLAPYTISKQIGGTFYYGSSSLAVDPTTGLFFTNTSMSFSGGAKDIVAVNTNSGSPTTVVATTPSTLDNYFFVKMGISPTGTVYAIGVTRDTTITTAATANPLISFTPCATAGCANATLKLLGYLPPTAPMTNWNLYNGDLAFSSTGDLYYLSAAYHSINGNGRYEKLRLFKISAVNIPSVAGTGTIPMSFVADYTSIDSTVLNGLAVDPMGTFYISTRRFAGPQNLPLPTYLNELYKSSYPGSTSLIRQFLSGSHTAGYAMADLASCYFPLTVLESNILDLSGSYASGNSVLKWTVNNNTAVKYYEVQRSDDGENFITIANISPEDPAKADHIYNYNDPQNGFGKPAFYRIRQVMNTGMRFYSSIVKINFNRKINIIGNPKPNPFISSIDVEVELKAASNIFARLSDQSGRTVYSHTFSGQTGDNRITLNEVSGLPSGLYVLELRVDDEVLREKMIKK